jgi:hypothetical protein
MLAVTPDRWRLHVAVAALLIGAAVITGGRLADAQPAPQPLQTLVFLARADNPVDALGAGAVAGTLGAPVLLTGSARLDAAAAEALQTIRPDLVVLAGGTGALSAQVEADVAALGLAVRRVAGSGRTQTAAAVAAFAAELGAGRPVVTGRPVTADVIPGLNAERLGGSTATQLQSSLTGARRDWRTDGLANVGEVAVALEEVTVTAPVAGHLLVTYFLNAGKMSDDPMIASLWVELDQATPCLTEPTRDPSHHVEGSDVYVALSDEALFGVASGAVAVSVPAGTHSLRLCAWTWQTSTGPFSSTAGRFEADSRALNALFVPAGSTRLGPPN